MKNIVTIGTIYVDIKGYPTGDFIPAGRNVGEIAYFHGGVARNIAEDVARLGENSALVGLIDASAAGCDVLKHLSLVGVNTDFIHAAQDGMGSWMAIFDKRGEVCANISKRPDLLPICDILRLQGDEIFNNADGILLEIDIDAEIVDKTMRMAAKRNLPVYAVISNMAIAMGRMHYIRQAACFVCNRQEAGMLFEKETLSLSPREMLALLTRERARLGISAMAVTMDAEGAVFAAESGEAGICPAMPVKVVDTTGAGDAFFAGTSVGLVRGLPFAKACALGTKAAANVITAKENVLTKAL